MTSSWNIIFIRPVPTETCVISLLKDDKMQIYFHVLQNWFSRSRVNGFQMLDSLLLWTSLLKVTLFMLGSLILILTNYQYENSLQQFSFVIIWTSGAFLYHCLVILKRTPSFGFIRNIPNPLFHIMMTSSNGNIYRVTGPFWGESTIRRWILLPKASDPELLMFSLICAWTDGWANIRDAGDLRRHHAHYDVTVMRRGKWPCTDVKASTL